MKIVQVVPKFGVKEKLKTLLNNKEKELRKRGTTFHREKAGRWKHLRYPGSIKWDAEKGGMLIAEIHPKKGTSDWQLLLAFVGYLDRHLGKSIDCISISFR